jgi:hypothetical protein
MKEEEVASRECLDRTIWVIEFHAIKGYGSRDVVFKWCVDG